MECIKHGGTAFAKRANFTTATSIGVLKLVLERNLQVIYPYMEKVLRLFLTVPVATAVVVKELSKNLSP